MKRILGLSMAVGMLGLSSALAGTESVPTAQALWQEIQILQKNQAIMPESRPFQVGSRTVDAFTTDLANPAAVQSIAQAGDIIHVSRYADHSLLVKENYGMDKQLTGVTAMLKLSGYDAGDRNWVMAAYKPDGTVVAFGKIGSCIACHTMVRQQDFVFAPPTQQLLPVGTWKAFFPKQEMNPAYVALLKEHPEVVVK